MKKRIALLLSAVLAVSTLATACGGGSKGGAEVKVGLGLHTTMTSSKNAAADADGLAQADLTVAAVTLKEDGTIASVKVDCIQVKTNFDATGKITSDTAKEFKTKKELGYDYNMKETSAQIGVIKDGAEWFEQAENFEKYCVGKTADQVAKLVGEDGATTDEALKGGCTIKIGGLTAAVVKACNNAKAGSWKASADDTLNLGLEASISSPADAGEQDGTSTAYANFTAVTTNKDGKITACVLDAVQAKVTWNTKGETTSNLSEDTTTKYDLKEKYGMKETSKNKGVIADGGEWFEQANAFMSYVVGKNLDEVKAIDVDESGYPTDKALTSGCTMKVKVYITAIAKALAK